MKTGAQLDILLGGGMMKKRFYSGASLLKRGTCLPLNKVRGDLAPPLVARLKICLIYQVSEITEKERKYLKKRR